MGMIQSVKYVLLILLLCVNGCFSSLFTLGSPNEAKTSRIYVGEWTFPGKDPGKDGFTMSIRNFDDKSYVIRMEQAHSADSSEEKPMWFRGFAADVKERTFAHIKALNDDGTLDDEWEIYRIAVTDGGQLILRPLNDEFFKSKTISSDNDLRKIVAENLDNDALYGKDSLTGTRVVKKAD